MQVNSINILMNFKEFAYQRLLLEANKDKRAAYLTEKYGKKLKELLENNNIDPRNYTQTGNMVTVVVERIDPTEGEYSEWIIKHILTIQEERKLRRFFDEDFWAVQEYLTKYHKYKKLFKRASIEMNNPNTAKLSDINQIKGFNDLYEKLQLIEHYIEKEEEKVSLKDAEKDAEKIYNSDNYLILSPKTIQASCAYGRNTRWCTAAQNHNYFEHYNKQGPLYIIIDKKKNEKYQFHFQSGQYMDSNDDSISTQGFMREHEELNDPILKLAQLNKNIDFILTNGGSDWFVEQINNDSVEKQKYYIQKYALVALKMGEENPELVNNEQKLFKFEKDGTITLNTLVNEFSSLLKFIPEDDRDTADDILDGNYGYYTQGALEEKFEDFQYDWLDKKSIWLLRKYIFNSFNRDIQYVNDMKEFLEDVEDTQIEQLLALSYTSACSADLENKYIKRVIDNIVSTISPIKRKYAYSADGNIIFPGENIKGIIGIITDMTESYGEDSGHEFTAHSSDKTFFNDWARYLENNDDLHKLNLDNISYDPNIKEHGAAFNKYFVSEIVEIIPASQQMELDLSSINRDMTTRFDAFIKKIFQEGLGDMGQGGLAKRGGAGTTPTSSSSSTSAPKKVVGGVQMKHSNGPINSKTPTSGGISNKPMDYGAILNDPTAFELFQSDPQNIEGFRQHMADPKNFANLQKSIKDPKSWTTVAQLLASPQQ